MLASMHCPCTQTGATAVFSKQMGLLAGLVAESGEMIAAVTGVASSDVPSVLLIIDGFGLKTVCNVVPGFVVTSCGLGWCDASVCRTYNETMMYIVMSLAINLFTDE